MSQLVVLSPSAFGEELTKTSAAANERNPLYAVKERDLRADALKGDVWVIYGCLDRFSRS